MRTISSVTDAVRSRLRSLARGPLRQPVDVALAALSVPAAGVLMTFRGVGASRLPLTRDLLRTIGVFPILKDYYEPLFDTRGLARDLADDRPLPGIDLDVEGQLAFLERLARFAGEIEKLGWDGPDEGTGSLAFRLGNESFDYGDPEFLYAFLRHTKPGRVLEIGSGHSTRVARAALLRNLAETGRAAHHVCIEPFESPWLEQLGGVEVVRRKLEDCPPALFQELEAGDLLFIDSSHIIRPQGDVLLEYLELLPALRPGTYVHVHDIFTPRDYPAAWVHERVSFWNEQYLLEALLSNSPRYRVVAALNHLKKHHFARLRAVCPYLRPDRDPSSFYLTITAGEE